MVKKSVLVLVVLAVLSLGACATYSTRDGVSTPLGVLTSPNINGSREVIAEYAIILGLITTGYEEFLTATEGQEIDIIDTNYLNIYWKVQAVRRK
jgi:hypothetical protein